MRRYIFILFLISLVIFRYSLSRPVYNSGDKIRITGTVYSDPISYPFSQYIKLGGLKIYLPKVPEISYGDKIVVEGKVDGDKLNNPKLIKIEDRKGFGSGIRNKIIDFYQESLPEPYAGLIAGITLGSKGALSSDFWQKVKNSGVSHIVVASGTNVTFVVSFLFGIVTLFLPRRKAIPFVILGITLYLFLSGFEAPLIRAAIMSVIAFSAQELGRLVNPWRIFFLTILVMLLIKPDWITDIGFILSAISTLSLMLFEAKIRKFIEIVPEGIKESLSTTLAAQIGVAPILFVTFGQFNILSPIVNVLVLWTVPGIMLLGALGGLVGLIFPFLGKLILYLVYPLTWWFVRMIELFTL